MLSKRYESTEVERRTWLHVPSEGNSGPPAVTLTKWFKWCVHARYMKVLSVTVSTFKRRMEKKLGEGKEKWGAMHRLVVSFGTVLQWRRAYAFVLYGRRGSVGPPPEKFW